MFMRLTGRLLDSLNYFARVKRVFSTAFVATMMLCNGLACAELVTFEFSGTSADSQPRLGRTIRGYYTFESSTRPAYGGGAINSYDGATKAFQFVSGWYGGKLGTKEYGRWVQTEGNNRIRVTDRSEYRPLYSVRIPFLGNAALIDGYGPPSFYLTLDQYVGSDAFQNNLTSVPPDLAKFKIRTVSLQFVEKNPPYWVTNESYELTSLKRLPPGATPSLPTIGREFRQSTPYVAQSTQRPLTAQQAAPRIKDSTRLGAIQCPQGLVWRRANATDNVCVTPESRDRVAKENTTAASRIDPKGAYGPNSCIAGYVWREAFNGDLVCVTPEVRTLVRQENQRAAAGSR